MIRIIALEREYGSGAANIGQTLAERLGWKLWDHEITREMAKRLHCNVETVAEREERVDSVFYRLMKTFMRGSFEAGAAPAGAELLDAEHLASLLEKVVNEIAREGNAVIIGRGAPWFLRERDDTVRVFLYAPWEEKLHRILAQGTNHKDAENLLETIDRDRAAFIRKYYGKEWPDRYVYNLMINTLMGDEAAIQMILHHLELRNADGAKIAS